MKFRSSRGGEEVDLLTACDLGIAPDGGLFLPTALPMLPPPPTALAGTFTATAAWGLRWLLGDSMEHEVIDRITRSALKMEVPLQEVSPGRQVGIGGLHLLNLTCGPTRAFKDVGARFLAALWALHPREGGRTVLVATSGDTGAAVADACHGLPGLRVIVLFPEGRVSEIQRRQFTTLGGNVTAVAVEGSFDRCQAAAKAAFADRTLTAELGLTSANSINAGRLVPQVLPYLHLARQLGWSEEDPQGRPGRVVVPSGNLGNLWSALVARRVGAPLGEIVAACNRNDTVVRWLRDHAERGGEALRTPSTAMDVGLPSNLERIAAMEGDLGAFTAHRVEDDDTLARMATMVAAGRPVDPHTAVGCEVAARLGSDVVGPTTVVETASPAKFPEVMRRAGLEPIRDPVLDEALDREEKVVHLPEDREITPLLRELSE